MKYIFAIVFVCALSALALADEKSQPPPPPQIKDPQVNVNVGGSPKDGYNVNADVRKNIWTSDNGKHSFDATAGYGQHVGGPYGNSRPDYRGGGIYTYRW
ncbi:diptericin-D-like [Musca vetustissima]|uniref:diptericin-D-like n=1 Tax=Musca vetustissima TaxID=27455 RepID=UPI002AB72908|nr:diptericin-D-like [Musca vetustissima]